jgi:hypothetical protein
MHGGAPGSGAPKGNKNALKHGRFTAEAIAYKHQFFQGLRQIRVVRDLIEKHRASNTPESRRMADELASYLPSIFME